MCNQMYYYNFKSYYFSKICPITDFLYIHFYVKNNKFINCFKKLNYIRMDKILSGNTNFDNICIINILY